MTDRFCNAECKVYAGAGDGLWGRCKIKLQNEMK